MSLDHEDVLRILALLDASEFDELRIETTDYKLYLRRSAPGPNEAGFAPAAPVAAAAPEAPAVPPLPAAPASAPAASARDAVDVTAPLLGTFYSAPQPGAAPFVTVGAAVEPDTVIGIVEVMKLMNSVSAGTRGIVTEIVARDGTLVEYGQVLVRIAPANP